MVPELVVLALEFYRTPLRFEHLTDPARPLPEQFGSWLLAASSALSVGKIDFTATALNVRRDELQEAFVFFLRQTLLMPKADHYRVLGLHRDCSIDAVKQHHGLLVRLFHPDRMHGEDERYIHLAARINAAYQTLRNPKARSLYDRRLPPLPTGLSPNTLKAVFFRPQDPLGTYLQTRPAPAGPASRVLPLVIGVLTSAGGVALLALTLHPQNQPTLRLSGHSADQRAPTLAYLSENTARNSPVRNAPAVDPKPAVVAEASVRAKALSSLPEEKTSGAVATPSALVEPVHATEANLVAERPVEALQRSRRTPILPQTGGLTATPPKSFARASDPTTYDSIQNGGVHSAGSVLSDLASTAAVTEPSRKDLGVKGVPSAAPTVPTVFGNSKGTSQSVAGPASPGPKQSGYAVSTPTTPKKPGTGDERATAVLRIAVPAAPDSKASNSSSPGRAEQMGTILAPPAPTAKSGLPPRDRPISGHASETRAAARLIARFKQFYTNGNLRRLTSLFTANAVVNNSAGLTSIRAQYSLIFAKDRYRYISIFDVRWRPGPHQKLLGRGQIRIAGRSSRSSAWRTNVGILELELVPWRGEYRISKMYYGMTQE